jgi:hypothetical protein
VEFDFSGHIGVYKEVSQNNFFCTAKAHASAAIEWGGKVTYSVQSVNDKSSLKMDNSFQITRNDHNSGKNDCAKAFSWMGSIIGGIVGVFTHFIDGGYFTNMLSDAMRLGTPGIGDLNLAMNGLSDTVSSVVMLPAGQVFNFQNPSSDQDGNIVLQLKYQR